MNNFLKDDEAQRKIKKNKRDIIGIVDSSKNINSQLTKYVDVTNTSVISSTAQFVLLNGVAAGSDFYQRTNRTINGKEIKINIEFKQHATAIGYYPDDTARILVVWDHQADATPTISDVLLDLNTLGVTNSDNLSHKNINNKERFIFLANRRYALPGYTITTTNQINTVNSPQDPNNEIWSETINIKLDSFITRFNGTGSTISAINTGALYFIVFGSVPSSGWSVNLCARYSFYDI